MNCAWKEFLSILPPHIRQDVDKFGANSLQELRLRIGKPFILETSGGEKELVTRVKKEDLQFVVNASCGYSPWTAATVGKGFITSAGGHRIGICGEVIVRDGVVQGFGTMTGMNLRVARDFPGVSGNLRLRKENILILGPPGSGKTTMLRDLIRRYAQQNHVSVVDEREELFPPTANFETGRHTDILLGCNKKQGIDMLLRTMGPDFIAVDEITAEEDCYALMQAGWCGVMLLASAHASCVEDLHRRPVYKCLAESKLFDAAIVLRPDKTWYTERMKVGC